MVDSGRILRGFFFQNLTKPYKFRLKGRGLNTVETPRTEVFFGSIQMSG